MVKRYIPYLMLFAGLGVSIFAFLCMAANALPYQDATAEMLAEQKIQEKNWLILICIGLAVALCGGLLLRRRSAVKLGERGAK